jgi:pimeloyl-ACP methyl ester carboxylesterase
VTSCASVADPFDLPTSTPSGFESDAAHREDHTGLLAPFEQGSPRRVDAIVVPAGRTAGHLTDAAKLAYELRATLVVMRGPDREVRHSDVSTALSEWPGLRWYTVDVGARATHPLLGFGRPVSTKRRHLNLLSVKRNAALLLGRMLGWCAVLLLDDDIHGIDPDIVRAAASGLDEHQAVGLTVGDWPDNSVVCHANRRAGGAQTVFVSGAALIVDCTRPFGFFPDLYNEDWVFLFDWLRERAVAALPGARQLTYDPYDEPGRVRRQEFGEVVGEGMVDLLHHEHTPSVLTTPEYWATFLCRRGRFIAGVQERLSGVTDPGDPVKAALTAAEHARRAISPHACAQFVADYTRSGARWREQVDRLPVVAGFRAAAACLGLAVGTAPDPMAGMRPTKMLVRSDTHGPCGDLAVVLPGFLDTVRYTSTTMLVEALRTRATTVVPLELHGAWDSEAPIAEEYRVSRHLADLRWILDLHRCPCRRRTIVVGFCYGAQLAALAAARDTRITDVVALMPMRKFIWADDYDVNKDTWRRKRLRSFPRDPPLADLAPMRTFSVPYSVVQDALPYDSVAAFRALRRQRVLFVSGTDDPYTPFAVVERLRKECDNPSALHVSLPGVQHDYRGDRSQVERVNATVVDWLWPSSGSVQALAAAGESRPRTYRWRRGQVRL